MADMDLPISPPLAPMLAKAVKEMPKGAQFPDGVLYEPKWDGFRCIVFRDGDEVELSSRGERPLTRYFPELVDAVRGELPERCVVDGEIVVRKGQVLDFDSLSQRIHPAASRINLLAEHLPATFIAFDLLALGDESLMETPFGARRQRLVDTLRGVRAPIHVTIATDSYDKSGPIIGSLLLGLHNDEGMLQHVGVAASFSMKRRAELVEELQPYRMEDLAGHPWQGWAEQTESTADRMPGAVSRWTGKKDLSWVALRPELVCEVAYEGMEGNRIRHTARFRRWRPDRTPQSCTYEQLDRPVAYDLDDIFGSPSSTSNASNAGR